MKTFLAPYMAYIKIGVVLVLLSLVFQRGCSIQKDRDAGVIAKKDAALIAASNSLDAAAIALTAQNDANKKAIREAELALTDARNAGIVSDAQKVVADERIKNYAKRLQTAARNPSCKAILETNIKEACGL